MWPYFIHLSGEPPSALNLDAGCSKPQCPDWLGPPCTEELSREHGAAENPN